MDLGIVLIILSINSWLHIFFIDFLLVFNILFQFIEWTVIWIDIRLLCPDFIRNTIGTIESASRFLKSILIIGFCLALIELMFLFVHDLWIDLLSLMVTHYEYINSNWNINLLYISSHPLNIIYLSTIYT